ncbi:MAG: MarR family winged helix-turn-helix transcriptional regulator [Alphaproteobacteria bacterium]|jgi:DNA-binding MarR family transcriptional regulator|uniref:MarR family winged helix-turn-helix transcriptional regulator n=1 Tax=Pacificispira sp. TaxID=2888761 RepID=UPI001B03E786|nr:winged helix-turn-helix transcriptional regulator [Alphaproteobacteria bacterium]MBO6861088.1 winged helix-turn-helix transcriptional regulator [Alphaproteobacteria bacterium]MEC9267318.1 MarR family winged helix-turn-helix transcriptional regulator [Pseudomonadota bacterium]
MTDKGGPAYRVERQIGHLLRRAHQRASAIFQETLADPNLTPTQFAALMRLCDDGAMSQNHLGRLTAMDPATIQGVMRRLEERGLVQRAPDPKDRRRTILSPTEEGRELAKKLIPSAKAVSARTLSPLTPDEQKILTELLDRLG